MSRYRALIALPFALALASAACAKDPASGVIVALQTDMALPDDVTSVSLDVTDTSTGAVLQSLYGVIEGDNVRFPSTITIARGDSYNLTSVTIRVVAYKQDKAQVLRAITTTLPETDFALLPVDLSYLDWGSASGSLSEASPTAFGAVLSPAGGLANPRAIKGELCPEGQTSVYGECVPQEIDVNSLAKYSDALALGDNRCFDFQACFEKRRLFLADGVASSVDGGCTVRLPKEVNLDRVNFAVLRKRPPTSEKAQRALCKGPDCFVVLNRDSAPSGAAKHVPKGAYYVDAQDPQVLHLGTGLCKVLTSKPDLLSAVVAGYGCQPKTRETSICWPDVAAQANAPDPTVVPPAALVGAPVTKDSPAVGGFVGDFVLGAEGKPAYLAAPDGVGLVGPTGGPLLNISGESARVFVDPAGTTFLYGGYDAGLKNGDYSVITPGLGAVPPYAPTGKERFGVLDAAILQGGANFLAYVSALSWSGSVPPPPSFYKLTYDANAKAIAAVEISHPAGACTAVAADGEDVYVACGMATESTIGLLSKGATNVVPFAKVPGLVRSFVIDHPAGRVPTAYATLGGVAQSSIVRVDATSVTPLGAVLNASPFLLDDLLQSAQRSLILDEDFLFLPIEGVSSDPNARLDRILAIPKAGGDWQEIAKGIGDRPVRTVRTDANSLYWTTLDGQNTVLKVAPKCWKTPGKCN